MSENKKNKKMSLDNTMPLESHDSAAVKIAAEKGKKSFGRKV